MIRISAQNRFTTICILYYILSYIISQAQLHIDKSECLLELGDFYTALDECNEAIRLNDKIPKAFSLRAKIHLTINQIDKMDGTVTGISYYIYYI